MSKPIDYVDTGENYEEMAQLFILSSWNYYNPIKFDTFQELKDSLQKSSKVKFNEIEDPAITFELPDWVKND